jgi:hypothetical protein
MALDAIWPARAGSLVDHDTDRRRSLTTLLAIAGLVPLFGCATATPTPDSANDELQRADSIRGELFIRPDHNIGGYDQTFFPPIHITDRGERSELHDREVAMLSANLSKRLRARAAAGGLTVAPVPAPCAMTMKFSIIDIEIDRMMAQIEGGSNATFLTSMGAVTLEVVILDSLTESPLLRFTDRRKLAGGQLGGSGRGALFNALERALDAILTDFGDRLRTAIPMSTVQNEIAPQCTGRIRQAADAAARRGQVPTPAKRGTVPEP